MTKIYKFILFFGKSGYASLHKYCSWKMKIENEIYLEEKKECLKSVVGKRAVGMGVGLWCLWEYTGHQLEEASWGGLTIMLKLKIIYSSWFALISRCTVLIYHAGFGSTLLDTTSTNPKS